MSPCSSHEHGDAAPGSATKNTQHNDAAHQFLQFARNERIRAERRQQVVKTA